MKMIFIELQNIHVKFLPLTTYIYNYCPSSVSHFICGIIYRRSSTYFLMLHIAGENSARSSTYARVSDIKTDGHAPTPPPVDTLKQLAIPALGQY